MAYRVRSTLTYGVVLDDEALGDRGRAVRRDGGALVLAAMVQGGCASPREYGEEERVEDVAREEHREQQQQRLVSHYCIAPPFGFAPSVLYSAANTAHHGDAVIHGEQRAMHAETKQIRDALSTCLVEAPVVRISIRRRG